MEKQEKKKLDSFVAFPRKIKSDLLNGTLTRNEYLVYGYLRLSGNPYGVATTSLADIRADIFRNEIGTNYCNKILLSLKRKRYIYYKRRAGSRGSFEVELGDWILKGKPIKTLDKFFEDTAVRDLSTEVVRAKPEESQSNDIDSQSFENEYTKLRSGLMDKIDNPQVRGAYNDNDNDK